jgi:protein gp37
VCLYENRRYLFRAADIQLVSMALVERFLADVKQKAYEIMTDRNTSLAVKSHELEVLRVTLLRVILEKINRKVQYLNRASQLKNVPRGCLKMEKSQHRGTYFTDSRDRSIVISPEEWHLVS